MTLSGIVRGLRRSPLFSITAVLVLAVGMGAATAVFSIFDGVLLRPLPYANPEELTSVYSAHPRQGETVPPSYLDFLDWRDQIGDRAELTFSRATELTFRSNGGAERYIIALVSPRFFDVLAVRPLFVRCSAAVSVLTKRRSPVPRRSCSAITSGTAGLPEIRVLWGARSQPNAENTLSSG